MKFEIFDQRYKEFILNIRSHFKDSKNSIHKARNEIKITPYNDTSLVIKSFRVPNFINKIIYTFFKDSKAKKSYLNSIKIIDFVPKPIGYIEFEKSGLIYDSYFISEEFKYDFTIREPLLDSKFEDRESIFKEFAKFTFDLHQNNILHLDYSPGNILIKKDTNGYIFKIVDINRMKFLDLDTESRLKNFAQLWAKDDDLSLMIKEYLNFLGKDEKIYLPKALAYSQAHKDKKNFKKRLKGKKVVD